MNFLKPLIAGLSLAASSFACAGTLYTWQTTGTTADMRSMSGFIELRDGASGHISYQARNCGDWPCDLADPASPILRFGFDVNQYPDSALAIDLLAGTGYGFNMPSFDAEFDIGAGRIDGLTLFVNTITSTLRLDGDTITWFSSDADNCYWGCQGGQGQFLAPARIPEPGSLGLLALAGAALMARRRRR